MTSPSNFFFISMNILWEEHSVNWSLIGGLLISLIKILFRKRITSVCPWCRSTEWPRQRAYCFLVGIWRLLHRSRGPSRNNNQQCILFVTGIMKSNKYLFWLFQKWEIKWVLTSKSLLIWTYLIFRIWNQLKYGGKCSGLAERCSWFKSWTSYMTLGLSCESLSFGFPL